MPAAHALRNIRRRPDWFARKASIPTESAGKPPGFGFEKQAKAVSMAGKMKNCNAVAIIRILKDFYYFSEGSMASNNQLAEPTVVAMGRTSLEHDF
jgi:hypothetical protein